jgi:hypothetical protein
MNNIKKGLLGFIVAVCLWIIIKTMFPDYYNSLIGVKKTCEPGFSLNANVCEPIVCGPGYIMNSAKTGCDLIDCKPYEVRNASNLCVRVCPDAHWIDIQTGTCNPIVCNPGYKINSAGTKCDLIDCKPYEIRNASKLCEIKTCPESQWLDMQTGTCNPCGAGFRINEKNLCEPIVCEPGYKINSVRTGCESMCSSGQVYNASLNKCTPICYVGMELNNAGDACQPIKCAPGTNINAYTNKCEAITCPEGQYYNRWAGKCSPYCPSGKSLDLLNNICR